MAASPQITTHDHYTKMMLYICIKFHGLNFVRLITHIHAHNIEI